MAEPVLRIEALRKAYNVGTPIEVEVLHGLDFGFGPGEFCALMGPSGSGKSTLLNIIGLLDRATGGRLFIDGQETGRLDDKAITRLRGRSLGFVFQYHYLIPAFTALENVMMPMLVDRGRPDAAMRRRARELLEQVGLTAWRDNLATNMSGGQQQRVAVARALAMNPSLVLADEPTGNLDTRAAQGVFDLMRHVNRRAGTTLLIVTHNHGLAAQCDRIVELVDGRLVSDRRPRLRRPTSEGDGAARPAGNRLDERQADPRVRGLLSAGEAMPLLAQSNLRKSQNVQTNRGWNRRQPHGKPGAQGSDPASGRSEGPAAARARRRRVSPRHGIRAWNVRG